MVAAFQPRPSSKATALSWVAGGGAGAQKLKTGHLMLRVWARGRGPARAGHGSAGKKCPPNKLEMHHEIKATMRREEIEQHISRHVEP